jgi:4-amino-4-deoxy-L-arabinose transferase-like glycosyltransferase
MSSALLEVETKQKPRLEEHYAWIVAGVAFAAALAMVFIVFAKQGLVDNAGDPYDYGKIAHGFVERGFDKLTRRAASLYPTFLSLIYGLGFGDRVVQLIHCLLHAGTATLVFVMGRRLFNARTGLIAGLFTAVHPMLLRYVPDLHMETWLTFLCTTTIWRSLHFYKNPTVLNGVLMGIVGTMAVLSKGVMLPFLAVFTAVWGVRGLLHLKHKRSGLNPLFGAVAIGLTMCVLIAPWTYRNYKTSGHFVLLTPGTPDAFLRGYIFTRLEFATLQSEPFHHAENESNALFRKIAREAGTEWELDEVVDDKNNAKVMKEWIRTRPLDTVRKVVVGLFTFWYEMTTLKNSLVPFTLAIVNWALAFVGMKRARAEGRPVWLLLLPILALNVFVAFLVPLGRYSTPILPTLAILAAFGVDTLLERRKARAGGVRTTATT